MQKPDLGKADIQPQQPVTAGTFTTIHYTYTAGHPIDDSGYIKITFRVVSDCGAPQFDKPGAPNYCSVHTDGDCHIIPRWDPKGHTRPWSRALFLQVQHGYLDRDETIQVIFGEKSQGCPGWQMQTFCARSFEFKTFVDPIATYEFKELPVSPAVVVSPGVPVRAVCIVPSEVSVHTPFTYYLKLEDKWGNPTGPPNVFQHEGFEAPGIQTIRVVDQATKLAATSNPIKVTDKVGPFHPYWADFHGQSEETVGTNPIEDYFVFARDYGLVDILGHQGNDFQVTDEFWDKVNEVSKQFYVPGKFATFPGYEWSGNTPLGGDRNVYFLTEGGTITRSGRDLLPGQSSIYPDSPTVLDLFSRLKTQDGPTPFVFAHVGGRYADLKYHDAALELAVEVHSAWGTFEWLVEEALERGYRIGICANSDGHKCRPGASYPGAGDFGSYGGLTCVLAPFLDRESIYQALVSRHFYATTGNRPLLDIQVTTAGQTAMMGDIIQAANSVPHVYGTIIGTGPIENIEVRNGLDCVHIITPEQQDELGHRIKITWGGAEVKGRNRMVRWDGQLHIQGNAITSMTPVNFLNHNQPLELLNDQVIRWTSATTGGTTGMILTLEQPVGGVLDIHTNQLDAVCNLSELGTQPKVWNCGGLRKEIRVVKLPSQPGPHQLAFDMDLELVHPGDNPIYIRMLQEDGHMAWTSPVYLVVDA